MHVSRRNQLRNHDKLICDNKTRTEESRAERSQYCTLDVTRSNEKLVILDEIWLLIKKRRVSKVYPAERPQHFAIGRGHGCVHGRGTCHVCVTHPLDLIG